MQHVWHCKGLIYIYNERWREVILNYIKFLQNIVLFYTDKYFT